MDTPIILFIDRELFFRQLFSDLLEPEGFTVESAESGHVALGRIKAGRVDLVVADLSTLEGGLRPFLHECRSVDPAPEVLLTAGFAERESAAEGLGYGAADYLIKPFFEEELRHRIHGVLERKKLTSENAALSRRISWLQKTNSLVGIFDRDLFLGQAVDLCLREVGATRGFAVVREGTEHSELHGLVGFSAEEVRTWVDRLFPCIPRNEGLICLDAETTRQFGLDKTLWIFPLRAQGSLRGALVFCTEEVFSPNEKMDFLLQQIALGFDRAWRFEQAQQLMYTDDLTGLYNHRYLQVALDQELSRSGRYGLEFALVFVDLDYFKEVNDRFGHLVGSAILRETAQLLRKCVRDADILFRYGGDEFTALLLETEDRGAEVVAERIRRTLADHCFMAEDGIGVRLTATIGYAVFPTDAEERLDLLNLADRAMYWGKTQRNVVRSIRDVPTN
ncbi:MAG: diguanylate cyclase response regulator [Thermodesulfobacteriota bacterium]|jgi:diguanylate cyclase (GGDEF)-like protein|nr:diguanylate cyclase response regulator [Thermodesulfobacteriota bacterium]